jgi:Arylsulfotransferase (ASST)
VFKAVVRKPILVLAAALASVALVIASTAGAKSYTTKGAWSFVSAPGVNPPKIRTAGHVHGKLASGYFMVANFKDLVLSEPMVGEGGPLILNSHLQPVWFKPVKLNITKSGKSVVGSNATTNLHEQTLDGKPVLSWWQGSLNNAGATLSGEDIVVNQHYQTVATLKAQGPTGCAGAACWVISEHEFLIQGHDAWVTAYRNVPMNLTKYGGPANGTVIDTAVQEYDLTKPAGSPPILSWDALNPGGTPHIPLSDSHSKPLKTGVWDAYHENSISLGNNSFLVSMRNDWTAYDVDVATGNILWKLSGDPKQSTFKLPSNARFQWQHDVELHPGNVVSVFDDHCCNVVGSGQLAAPTGPARGLVLKLNLSKHTASLVHAYGHGSSFFVPFLGNTQLVPGGNVMVGWGTGHVTTAQGGSTIAFTEYSNGGSPLLDAAIPNPDLSYRTYLQSWVGLPLTLPSAAVRSSRGKTTVYASWNGATKVVAWRVLAGSSMTHLSTVVSHASKTGFETSIPVKGTPKTFKVEALSSSGKVLGTSKAFGKSSPAPVGSY